MQVIKGVKDELKQKELMPKEEVRTKRIQICVNEEEYRAIRKRAFQCEMTASSYALSVLMKEIETAKTQDK